MEAVTASGADDAHAQLAFELIAAGKPCDVPKVSLLFDRYAFLQLIQTSAQDHRGALAATDLMFSLGAQKVCSWLDGASALSLLRVRTKEGEPRAVFRKISETGFGHYELRATQTSNGLRILDVYSHNNGTWISAEIAETAAVPAGDDPKVGATILQVNALEREGKHREALTLLDSLPEGALASKPIQSLRVAVAGRVSVDAYKQAQQEHARRFPEHKPTPISAMNAAFMKGDFAEALHQIDVLDAAVGGDPFLDTIRASITAQRNGPGDLDAAAALVDRAVIAMPDLSMPLGVRLTLAVMRKQWAVALTTIDTLERDFGAVFSDEVLRAAPNLAPLLATPEYAAWRQRHP